MLEKNSKPKFYRTSLGLFRAYAFLTGVMILIGHVNISAEDYDPLWLRLIPGLLYLGVWTGSFFVHSIRKNIVFWVNICLSCCIGWLAFLMAENNFGQVYVSGFVVFTFASILVFETRISMLLFSIWVILMLVLASLQPTHFEFHLPTLYTLTFGILVASNLSVGTRLYGREVLKQGLEESNTIQDAALESSRDAILLVDEEGNLLKCNKAFSEMWELPPDWVQNNQREKVLQHCLPQAKDPAKLNYFVGQTGTSLPNGELLLVEFKDGRHIEAYWMPLRMAGKNIGRLWFLRDITKRKIEEQRLKDSEARLRINNERLMEFAGHKALISGNLQEAFSEISRVSAELMDVDTVGIWTFDEAFEEMMCEVLYRRQSDDFADAITVPIKNYPKYLEVLRNSRTIVVKDTRNNPITTEFYKGKYTGRAASLIHAQIRASGRMVGVISLEKSSGPHEWTLEDESFVASMADLVAVSLETNERRKVQINLESSNAVLQAIFELSETGILVEDTNHRVLNYNDLYLKTWNMSRDFLENSRYEDILEYCISQTNNTTEISQGVKRLSERPGMEYAGIIEFVDGKIVERYSKAIKIGGEIRGRAWFYLDITDRKKKEIELINRNFELDSFVYRASHDLKAPLNSIMGLINIIQEEQEADIILSYISMMDKSVKKLDAFIKQLTQFSQDARLKIVRQPIDFQEMIDDILSDLRFMENAARVDMQVSINQQGEFQSDPVRLGIVFNNIISNAIKYQDLSKDTAILKIEIEAGEQHAICRFEDNGVGIDSGHLEKVFDLFFRASVQATGSGLGLYITHNAIDKMGGKIQVNSEIGHGTTFFLDLPNRLGEED